MDHNLAVSGYIDLMSGSSKWMGITFVISVLAFCSSCQPSAPQRGFAIDELLLDETVFPPNTRSGDIYDPPGPRNSVNRTAISYHGSFGLASYDVYQCRNESKAIQEFNDRRDIDFRTRRDSKPWITPIEWSYVPPNANQFYFACGSLRSKDMCTFIAQYEEFFIRFDTHMHSTYMTLRDIEQIARAMDEHTMRYLDP